VQQTTIEKTALKLCMRLLTASVLVDILIFVWIHVYIQRATDEGSLLNALNIRIARH